MLNNRTIGNIILGHIGEQNIGYRAAKLILGMVGLDIPLHRIFKHVPESEPLLKKIASNSKYYNLTISSIRSFSHIARVPLLDNVNISDNKAKSTFGPTDNEIDALYARSPFVIGFSDHELLSIKNNLESTKWKQLYIFINKKLRLNFDIAQEIDISYILFGSYVWAASDTIGDLDITIILESDSCSQVEVGAHTIFCPGLSRFLSNGRKVDRENLNISLIGRSAVSMGSINHDLSNAATWNYLGGVRLHGYPLVNNVCDYMIAQDILVTAGFSFKGIMADTISHQKYKLNVVRGLQTAILLGDKYSCSSVDEWTVRLNELRNYSSEHFTTTYLLDLLQNNCKAALIILDSIKEKAINTIPNLLKGVS